MEEKALVATSTHEVDFYGDRLHVALMDNVPYVAVKPITDFLGLLWGSQYNRIQRDPVLAEEARLITMTGADGKQYKMYCLPIELMHGWLFGITTSKVNPEYVEKLNRYRRECFRILWQAFQSRALAPETIIPQLVSDQAETRVRVGNLEQEMKSVRVILSEIRGLSNEHRITAKEMVDQLHKISGTQHRSIWSDLNKAFRVPSYTDIPDEKWTEVQQWLQLRLDSAKKGKGIEQQSSLFDTPEEN